MMIGLTLQAAGPRGHRVHGRRLADVRARLAEQGRDPSAFETHLCHDVNINEDEDMAYEESRRFLERCYGEAAA